MLRTQVAEVSVLQVIVLVTVHVGEDLQDNVPLEPQLHRIDHVGKVGEVDHTFGADVKRPVRCRHFAKLVDYALGQESQLCLEFKFIVFRHGLFSGDERIIPSSSVVLCPVIIYVGDQGGERRAG